MGKNSLKKNLEILRAAGLAVPTTIYRFSEDQDLRNRDIQSVWKCNCGYVYESAIRCLDFDHGCGKLSKLIWTPSEGFIK